MEKSKIWDIVSKKSVFKERIFEIFKLSCYLPSKNIDHEFFSIDLHNWTNVFALTKEGKVILVKQHRLGKNQVTIEVPAGAINKDEKPEDGAIRELEEETGYKPKEIKLLKKISVNPAIQNNTCHFYIAFDCEKNSHTKFDTSEELEIILMNKEELFNALDTDLMDNSLSFLAVMLAEKFLTKG